jgi:hypothetical protein
MVISISDGSYLCYAARYPDSSQERKEEVISMIESEEGKKIAQLLFNLPIQVNEEQQRAVIYYRSWSQHVCS